MKGKTFPPLERSGGERPGITWYFQLASKSKDLSVINDFFPGGFTRTEGVKSIRFVPFTSKMKAKVLGKG